MKRLLCTLLALGWIFTCAICVAEDQPDGMTLSPWIYEEGWTSFSTYAQVEALDDAWAAAAAAFGPMIGIQDLDASTLKMLNAAACGFEDGVAAMFLSGNTVTALDQEGNVVFEHDYHFVDTLESALEGMTVYVYAADDEAGRYTYLCMTLPEVAVEEGGIITNFNLRCAESDYAALFEEGYDGVTHVLVHADTPLEDVDYTIRLVYSLGAVE